MGIEVFKWLQLCNRDTPHARKRTGGKRGKRHTERSSSSHFAAVEEHTAFILQLKEVPPAERTAPSLAVMRQRWCSIHIPPQGHVTATPSTQPTGPGAPVEINKKTVKYWTFYSR